MLDQQREEMFQGHRVPDAVYRLSNEVHKETQASKNFSNIPLTGSAASGRSQSAPPKGHWARYQVAHYPSLAAQSQRTQRRAHAVKIGKSIELLLCFLCWAAPPTRGNPFCEKQVTVIRPGHDGRESSRPYTFKVRPSFEVVEHLEGPQLRLFNAPECPDKHSDLFSFWDATNLIPRAHGNNLAHGDYQATWEPAGVKPQSRDKYIAAGFVIGTVNLTSNDFCHWPDSGRISQRLASRKALNLVGRPRQQNNDHHHKSERDRTEDPLMSSL
ncbi:hypothetical protein NM208_g11665 [Fusarium decemcellulare]|uniref:Uncharacterized protein n=1 Tax=Fusarium decemcellulare TaxID=57161 RepID=A0ACC1RSX4_9HYPO|nr:hypothetical protein NM208_g11665 [Fusarium decemcellulare]